MSGRPIDEPPNAQVAAGDETAGHETVDHRDVELVMNQTDRTEADAAGPSRRTITTVSMQYSE